METGSSDHPARLRVGIIGPGRAGTALGRALEAAGHRVVAAHAISESSVRHVRENFRLARLADPADVIEDSDLVLLTVPDDDLEGLVRGLADTGAPLAGRMLAHASLPSARLRRMCDSCEMVLVPVLVWRAGYRRLAARFAACTAHCPDDNANRGGSRPYEVDPTAAESVVAVAG